jgi:SAM-dependent methyltransferase
MYMCLYKYIIGRIGFIYSPSQIQIESDMSDIQQLVREKCGAIAASIASGHSAGCGGPASCGCGDPVTSDLYSNAETNGLPADAMAASLGCGNPMALVELKAGQTVLDLGSGGGIDVLLAARKVGPTGKVYGLEMTDEMLALARENQHQASVTNVEFLKGLIEAIPLADATVDVVISNCVINLSGDKDAVLREAFRVLKPGGRFAVSDVVARGYVPSDVRRNLELWCGCMAGALDDREYETRLRTVGFEHVQLEPWRRYRVDELRAVFGAGGVDVQSLAGQADGTFVSASVRATKPAAAVACCGPTCCTH